ncbi:MAG: DNA polymerase III subunit delta [Candidatus Binatia bacterium]
MSAALESVRAAIAREGRPSLLLLYGDDFQVRGATAALINDLVPSQNRAFNLEKFDGRSAGWDEVEAALMTPPFFPGKKVVLVENAPYFLAQERKGEIAAKVLELWNEEKQEEAARLLFDLLSLQGWTEEEWERVQGKLSPSQITYLCAADEEKDVAQIEELLAFCRSRLGFSQRRSRGGHGLAEIIERGLPPWAVLLLTTVHVDRRTRLYRRFEETGKVLDFTLERDRSGRIARDALADLLERRLKEASKKMNARGKEIVLQRAGNQLWSLHQELEKLFLYTGDLALISAEDVEAVFIDQGEDWIFDLTGALAQKDAAGALKHLARLLAQGDHPLKILAVLASEVRRLLAARALIEGGLRERWKKSMTYTQFQTHVVGKMPQLLTRNPYGDYLALQRADNFTIQELIRYLGEIRDADVRLKSTRTPPPTVLERLILEICLGNKLAKRANRAPATTA